MRSESSTGIEFTIDDLLALAESTRRLLRDLGVGLPPKNRLDLSVTLLRASAAGPNHTPRESLDAQQNVIESYLIAFAATRAAQPSHSQKLRSLVSGSVTLEHDARSASRDEQFELLVWAVLSLAGLGRVHVAEPDLMVLTKGGDIGVAVKRMSSTRTLNKHIGKAGEQIAKSKAPIGLLALNVDVPARQLDDSHPDYITSVPERVQKRLPLSQYGAHLDAVLVIGAKPSMTQHGIPSLGYEFATRVFRVEESERRELLARLGILGGRLRDRTVDALRQGIGSAGA